METTKLDSFLSALTGARRNSSSSVTSCDSGYSTCSSSEGGIANEVVSVQVSVYRKSP